MAQKSINRIGLIFSYNERWIAGSYYILNLISSLKTLPIDAQPHLCVYAGSEEEFEIVRKTLYPTHLLSFHLISTQYASQFYPFWQRIINKISLKITKKLVFDNRPKAKDINICFPNANGYYFEKINKNQCIYWIPDFQEKYLPQFFTQEDLSSRDNNYKNIAFQGENNVVFSSQDAKNDFEKFYPKNKAKTFILNFAVTHPDYKHLDFEKIKQKHNLPDKYFFSPNQFWKHKNQIAILKAIKLLKEKGIFYKVAFSGKMHDYRNPEYSQMLLDYVKDNNLGNEILFLGFLDRAEQLKIMQEAQAVIQPSLFEGWSTVVEDAKAMSQFVILSDLNVHKEQMQENILFFNPNSAEDLAEKLLFFEENNLSQTKKNVDYEQNIQKFAKDFLSIVQKV